MSHGPVTSYRLHHLPSPFLTPAFWIAQESLKWLPWCILAHSSIHVSNTAARVELLTHRPNPDTVQLPICRRNLSYSNCSLQSLHPGHCCCCDLLFCHCFLPSSTHSSCAVASCVLFSPSILTFFPWKGFFSWCLFNSFKPSSHLHQTRTPCPLSEVLFFPSCFQSLSWIFFSLIMLEPCFPALSFYCFLLFSTILTALGN